MSTIIYIFFSFFLFFLTFFFSFFPLEFDRLVMINKIVKSFPLYLSPKTFGVEGAIERYEYYLEYILACLKQDLSGTEIMFLLDFADHYESMIEHLTNR